MARRYGPKASEKVEQTMHEFKRGKLKSGSGKKVTSREQAIAIGLSQARRGGGKVPPPPPRGHATMWKPGPSIDDKVRACLSHMKPGAEIDARGMARAIREDALGTDYALGRAVKEGYAVTEDDKWYGPALAVKQRREQDKRRHHATKKSPAQLDREIAEVLRGPRRVAHVGFGSSPSSKLPTPPRFAERMAATQYKPTRAERHDPTLPKGETFTVLAARTLAHLGSSSTVAGAMQKAPSKGDVFVRGEYTSDGHHWGLGKGRLVAQRENGRWLRG